MVDVLYVRYEIGIDEQSLHNIIKKEVAKQNKKLTKRNTEKYISKKKCPSFNIFSRTHTHTHEHVENKTHLILAKTYIFFQSTETWIEKNKIADLV